MRDAQASPDALEYLGVKLRRITLAELVDEFKSAVVGGRTLAVSAFGFHTANVVASSRTAKAAFGELDIVCADGIAVVWTSWLFGRPLSIANRIAGDVSVPALCAEALREGWSVYLLGAAPGFDVAAAASLQVAFPGLSIAGAHHGYLSSVEETDTVIADINRSQATIVLVGMGQPLQEEWIVANRRRVRASVMIAVGAYFNHLARRADCYPAWVYACRLNWAYRLVTEPRRLLKRYTIGVLQFCWRLGRRKLQMLRGDQRRHGRPRESAPRDEP